MTLSSGYELFTWDGIGWALIHFVWQGAFIGLFSAAILYALPRSFSQARYIFSFGALLLCLITFITTAVSLSESPLSFIPASVQDMAPTQIAAEPDALGKMDPPFAPNASGDTQRFLGFIVIRTDSPIANGVAFAWMIGMGVLGIRFTRFWLCSRTLQRCETKPLNEHWTQLFTSLKNTLGIRQTVRILESALAETPMVVGWLKPVILIPTSAFTTLNEDELALICAHELAHIKRLDHLANLVQGIIEIALFFHPVTWWLSRQVRNEREHCCDETTLTTQTNPTILANALLKLESMRATQHIHIPAQLSASGGNLMKRITRLFDARSMTNTRTQMWHAPIALAIGSVIAAGCIASASANTIPGEATVTAQDRGEARQEARTNKEKKTRNDNRRSQRGAADQDEKAASDRMAEMMYRLGEALKEGKITPAQAIERMNGAAERMNIVKGKKVDPEMQRKARLEYQEASDKMAEMVKAGKMTREQMQQRLDRMRMEMSGAGKSAKTDDLGQQRQNRLRYKEASDKMTEMVNAGKMTREQMQQRLDRMRMEMSGAGGSSKSDNRDQQRKNRLEYQQASDKMAEMVKAGTITREQMQQRLDRMREAMGASDKSAKTDNREQQRENRLRYQEASDKMMEMVEAGEITRKQMEERLNQMRENMAKPRRR
jgi:beta-lactamase regulating signal transducer with metallopeptidase domain